MMNSNSSSSTRPPLLPQSMATTSSAATTSADTDGVGGGGGGASKKVRKPYTITKSRESWTEEEHDKFLEGIQLFDRDWKKIEDFVGSKTVIQIRSHAQKYFMKVQKNGTIAHVPPSRPKRKAAHPYPQKASNNVLLPLQSSMAYPLVSTLAPGFVTWDDTSLMINAASSKMMPRQDEYTNLHTTEANIGSKGVARTANSTVGGNGSSTSPLPSSEKPKQGKRVPVIHGIPDFAEVYSFIGSVFDRDTKGHLQKLKEMDPINLEMVLLLMRNLSINLTSPDSEPVRKSLSSYGANTSLGAASGIVSNNQTNDIAY